EINPAGAVLLEADGSAEIEGRNVADFVAPEFRPAFQDLHGRVLRGESGILEFDAIGLKGARRRMETRCVPLRDDSKQVFAVLAVTRDVTGERRAEAVLRESEARYRGLFEQNPNPMCVTDR